MLETPAVPAFAHTPVLVDEVTALLAPRAGGVYVDGTVGGGGHAERILEVSSPDGQLIGMDRDPEALDAARERLERFGERVTLVHGRYAELPAILQALGRAQVDGILLDLGVSSPQLDQAERGFSFAKEGPLDMRMDPSTGRTAAELLGQIGVDELERILREYGEERYSKKLSRAIHDAARSQTLHTTADLAKLINRVVPRGRERIDPATRTFQALRIAVNEELMELEQFLAFFPDLLARGGRCAIISFHSLEDRPVKERFRELEWTSRLPPDLAAQAGERTEPICRALTRKPVIAGDDELARNPRARSAKLRACERA